MKWLYQPERHRPIEVCGQCRQPWPCADERARVAGTEAGRKAVERALEAARLMPKSAPTGGNDAR